MVSRALPSEDEIQTGSFGGVFEFLFGGLPQMRHFGAP